MVFKSCFEEGICSPGQKRPRVLRELHSLPGGQQPDNQSVVPGPVLVQKLHNQTVT